MSTARVESDLEQLHERVRRGGVVVLSGAGLSTESGIPDYRGPTGAQRTNTPMTFQEFVGSTAGRRRYWARSFLGWAQMAQARPNAGHVAVAQLQEFGLLDGIVTQNVDGLHQAAGAHDVIELHGGLDVVVCLHCDKRETRTALDARLRELNTDFHARSTRINPDGDAEIADDQLDDFVMASCRYCGSDLVKPDVVFFGENVPKPRVEACYGLVEAARCLLVLGSSLTVMSGLRFVRRAAKLGIDVAIVNQGPTRGDPLADLTLDVPLGAALTATVDAVRWGVNPVAGAP